MVWSISFDKRKVFFFFFKVFTSQLCRTALHNRCNCMTSVSSEKMVSFRCRVWLTDSWRGVVRVEMCWRKQAFDFFLTFLGLTLLPVGFPSGPPDMWGDIWLSSLDIMHSTHTHTHIARYAFYWWGDVSRRKSKPQLPEQRDLRGMFSWELFQLFTSWPLNTEAHTQPADDFKFHFNWLHWYEINMKWQFKANFSESKDIVLKVPTGNKCT